MKPLWKIVYCILHVNWCRISSINSISYMEHWENMSNKFDCISWDPPRPTLTRCQREALRNLRHPHIIRVLDVTWQKQTSNVKRFSCLGYIGDNKLPSHVGIIINHWEDPYQPTSISWKVSGQVFFRGSDEIYRLNFWDVEELILSILYGVHGS